MSKAFIAQSIQSSTEITGAAATRASQQLVVDLVGQLKRKGHFTLPGFGTFRVHKTRARKALNPRTREPIKVKAGRTVRFKVSPLLKKAV